MTREILEAPLHGAARLRHVPPLLVALALTGCDQLPANLGQTVSISCSAEGGAWQGGTFLVMDGRNQHGRQCFVINKDAVQAFMTAPNLRPEVAIRCEGSTEYDKARTLGELYKKGFRLTAIERAYITVNDAKVPLPAWTYSLEKSQ